MRSIKLCACVSALALTCMPVNANDSGPKYVFYMIGDGMGTAQRQVAEYYHQEATGDKQARLVMNSMPVVGINTTHSADSLVTDSAASGTALATGVKTDNGMLGMTADGREARSILEGAQAKGMATGLITTTRLTHATPAAFVAKNQSRNNENEIADSYAISGVDFFAGGGYRHFVSGEGSKRKDSKDLIQQFRKQDYKTFVGVNSTSDFRSYQPEQGDRVFAAFTPSHLPYEIDRQHDNSTPSIAEITRKGIDLLSKDKDGFFLMVEGGRIDHASHANDLAGTIMDTIAFDQAVATAMEFYHRHPEDTLIVITGDHETGGMGMGFGKNYFMNLDKVALTRESVEDKLQGVYQGDRPAFYQHIARKFQLNRLEKDEKALIERAMDAVDGKDPEQIAHYGGYDPVSIAIAHITSKRAGVYWTSYAHTATQLPLSAIGQQAEKFAGFKDNTEVAKVFADVMNIRIGVRS
ncbi:alkaline phosphatase [Endozoicomonas euniceicola]|uniref:Alkaline phosphatase n=1 Tax=Endozoicomonas euniceicola TaxID=1234143 RepID=A0ABY6H083_9GAMM|nr:alkaline phosphatase [Endozoicomonas euniceicola]UYM18458.1 alkaline phosphatase [Endozoicomonas euniceicola]